MLDGHFSTVYYELAEKISFMFVRAAAENIPALKDFKGMSNSTFLFYLVRAPALCCRAHAAGLTPDTVCSSQDGKEVHRVSGPKMTEIKAKITELSPKL